MPDIRIHREPRPGLKKARGWPGLGRGGGQRFDDGMRRAFEGETSDTVQFTRAASTAASSWRPTTSTWTPSSASRSAPSARPSSVEIEKELDVRCWPRAEGVAKRRSRARRGLACRSVPPDIGASTGRPSPRRSSTGAGGERAPMPLVVHGIGRQAGEYGISGRAQLQPAWPPTPRPAERPDQPAPAHPRPAACLVSPRSAPGGGAASTLVLHVDEERARARGPVRARNAVDRRPRPQPGACRNIAAAEQSRNPCGASRCCA